MRSSNFSSSKHTSPVNPQSGWVLFLLGVLIATFVGGAVRAFFSPSQLAAWVETRLRQEDPKFNLAFDKIEFALSDGLLPAFGFRFTDLLISSKNPCVTRSQMQISSLYIPVKFFSIFSRKIRFSDIRAGTIKYSYNPAICNAANTEESKNDDGVGPPPSPVNKSEDNGAIPKTNKVQAIQSFFKNRFTIELKKTRNWFDSLTVDHIAVMKGENKDDWFTVDNLSTDLTDKKNELELYAQISYLGGSFFETKMEPVDANLILTSTEGHLSLSGKFKEGEVNSHLHVNFNSENYDFQAQMKYLPLGDLILNTKGLQKLRSRVKQRLLWFSCSINATGDVNERKKLTLNAQNCGVSGEAGRIQSDKFQIMPFAEKKVEPFSVIIDKFSLKYLVELMGGKALSGLLTDSGKVSGVLNVDSHESLNFVGDVSDLEIMFTNQKRRRLQIVHDVSGKISLNKERLSGYIDKIDISGGKFEGILSFNVDRHLSNGLMQLKIDSLQFADQISNLMFYGKASPLQIYGQAKFENGRVSEWRGNFGFAKVDGDDWSLDELKADSHFNDGKFEARVRVKSISANKNSLVYATLSPLYLRKINTVDVQLDDMIFNLEITSAGGKWFKFKGADNKNNLLFASSAQWDTDNQLSGWVSVDFPKKKLLNWDVAGQLNAPYFVPSIGLLEELAGKSSTVKLDKGMSEEKRVEVLDRILESKSKSQLQSFSKTVVETAKKWIPGFPDSPDKKQKKTQKMQKK